MPTDLLGKVEAYLERTKTKATNLGRAATNDGSLIFDIRQGRSPTLKVVDRLLDTMKQNPRGLKKRR